MYSLLTAATALLSVVAAAPMLEQRDDNVGCTAGSTKPWTVTDFKYHGSWTFSTPAHQIAGGDVSFNLTNQALTYQALCTARSSRLSDFFYGEINYDCTSPNPTNSTKTTFSFNYPSGQVLVNQTWTCSDKTPTRWNGYAAGELDLSKCVEDKYENPDWEQGQIYSSRTIDCTEFKKPVELYKITAVA
jgi:hypothetical protein